MFSAKEVLLVVLTLTLSKYHRTLDNHVRYEEQQQSLGIHYGAKYFGELIALIITYFFSN